MIMDNDLEKAKTEILKEKELEIMYNKELAPIDRINFVKQKVEDALKKGMEIGKKETPNCCWNLEFQEKIRAEESLKFDKELKKAKNMFEQAVREGKQLEKDLIAEIEKEVQILFNKWRNMPIIKVSEETRLEILNDLKALKKELGDK